jgi:Spy/CpxP family protein refolding chaperone
MSTNDQARPTVRLPFGRRVRRGLIALAGATLMLGGLAACSHVGPHRGDMSQMSAEDLARMRQRITERVSSELNLDDAQRQRLGVLFDKLSEQRKAVMGADADPRAKVRTLLAGNTFDRAGAQQLVDQKTGAVRTAAPELIGAFGDFYDGLKPEQQQKLRDWMDKRGGRRWFGGHGMHMG